jgi:hypothetical protein
MNQAKSGLEPVLELIKYESLGCGMLILPVPLDVLFAIVTCRTIWPFPLAGIIEGVSDPIEFPDAGVKVMSLLVGGVLKPIAIFDAAAVI